MLPEPMTRRLRFPVMTSSLREGRADLPEPVDVGLEGVAGRRPRPSGRALRTARPRRPAAASRSRAAVRQPRDARSADRPRHGGARPGRRRPRRCAATQRHRAVGQIKSPSRCCGRRARTAPLEPLSATVSTMRCPSRAIRLSTISIAATVAGGGGDLGRADHRAVRSCASTNAISASILAAERGRRRSAPGEGHVSNSTPKSADRPRTALHGRLSRPDLAADDAGAGRDLIGDPGGLHGVGGVDVAVGSRPRIGTGLPVARATTSSPAPSTRRRQAFHWRSLMLAPPRKWWHFQSHDPLWHRLVARPRRAARPLPAQPTSQVRILHAAPGPTLSSSPTSPAQRSSTRSRPIAAGPDVHFAVDIHISPRPSPAPQVRKRPAKARTFASGHR